MKIYIPEEKDVLVNDSSYCYHGLCEVGQLNITFSLAEFIVFPVGSYCIVEGMRYTLTKPENVTMVHTRNYEYTLLMYDVSYLLDMYKLHNSVDRRLKYEMVAQPQEFVAELVANLNERGGGQWAVGDCIKGVEHLIAFSHNSVREALQMVAEAWKTEWSVGIHYSNTGFPTYLLNLKKIEYNKGTTNGVADAPALSYGKGKGFLSGVKRDNDSNSQEIFRMYVQGGERNIDRSKYISPYLLLPANAKWKHEDRTYEVSTDRYYIYNVSKGDKGYEATFDCPDVYPSRVGVVSGVEQDKEFYNIVDKDIALTLNYEKCKMTGEKMSVIFQSGMLAGREFDVSKYEQIRDAQHQYIGGRFLLCQQDSDGVTMPSGAFVPSVGDKYVVFGVKMPDEYICKDGPHMVGTKAMNGIGAEWELFKEACRNMYENEYQKYTFSGELDSIYLRDKWFNLGSKIVVGGYILFSAPFTKRGGELIRITGVKRYINETYKIELTLSNGMASTSFGTTIDKIEAEPIITESGNKSTLRYARRRFADAQETAKMLEASLLDKFTNGINPITVQTMQMLVGSEQLQFAFYKDVERKNRVDLPVVWDKTKKTLTVKGAGLYAFYSPQNKNLSPNKPTYMWRLTKDFVGSLGDDVAMNGYYLYLSAHGIGDNLHEGDDEAFINLSIKPQPYLDAYGYNLLVGILNSEYDGDRSFAPMHGFTEILPGRVTTDKVVSSDGLSYFDMLNNAMQLYKNGGNSRLSWKDGILEIIGKIHQMSGDGVAYEIGVFKGDYDLNTKYYKGDDVFFAHAGAVATYRFTNTTPTAGIPPVGRQDSHLFWKIVAMGANGQQGIPGEDGKGVEYIYTRTNNDAPPKELKEPIDKTIDECIPIGWTDDPKGVNSEFPYEWVSKRTKINDTWSNFSAPALWAKYSFNGSIGLPGAPIVFRGEYINTETYYGTNYRLDIVEYKGMYYVARNDAGEFRGIVPTDISKWNTFGAQFSSVATSLIISKMANIAGWCFFSDIIKSQNNTIDLDGREGNIKIKKDGNVVGKLNCNGLTLYGDTVNPNRQTVQIVPYNIGEITDIGSKSEFQILQGPSSSEIKLNPGDKISIDSGSATAFIRAVNEVAEYSVKLTTGGQSITKEKRYISDSNMFRDEILELKGDNSELTVDATGIVTMEIKHTDNITSSYITIKKKYESSFGTVIGKNGLYSYMGNNRFIYISENQAPIIRNGAYGIMIADDGIKKWNGSSWIMANI